MPTINKVGLVKLVGQAQPDNKFNVKQCLTYILKLSTPLFFLLKPSVKIHWTLRMGILRKMTYLGILKFFSYQYDIDYNLQIKLLNNLVIKHLHTDRIIKC